MFFSISKRGAMMPESPIRKLSPYADAAKKRGIKIYHLNIGQPDISPPKTVIPKIKNLDLSHLPYTPSEGVKSLRKAWVTYYSKQSIDVSIDDILVTTGASEAIFFLLNTITDAGDEIIIPEPFYANYLGFATASEIKIKPVTSSLKNNFSMPSISNFEQCITSKTKAIMICNPGNPTGYLYTKKEILKLSEIAKKHGLYLIADEVYREFVYDDSLHFSIMNVNDFQGHAVMIDSVSKRYNLCGIRIGCIVTKNKALLSTLIKFSQARLSPPIYGQIAAEEALKVEESYYTKVIEEYHQRRDLLIEELNKIPSVEVSIPKGAFYCIASLPVRSVEHFSKWLLEHFSYNDETLMLSPASGFYITPNIGENQARIAYVLQKEELKKAMKILKKALETYPNSN